MYRNLFVLAVLAAIPVSAQSGAPIPISVNAADVAAGRGAGGRHGHGKLKNTPAATASRAQSAGHGSGSSSGGSGNNASRGPGDLSYNGGALIVYAQSHAIYMNSQFPGFPATCPTVAACWGDPEAFLRDLGNSEFIHIADQYVKATGDNRYTVGKSASINYVPAGQMSDFDILATVHAVAASTGQTGYGHIYHVFLPPGQDVCLSDGICASNAICAYHSSADFPDIGHVVYTVEPDQLGFGCAVAPGSPNGPRNDSTDNVLSHEMFETITDPDGDAWFNTATLLLLNDEIGDECEFITPFFFEVPIFKIGSKIYAVQREYDNSQHTCAVKAGI